MSLLPLAKTLAGWLVPLLMLAHPAADQPPVVEATPQIQAASWTRITFYDCIPSGYCGTTATGVQVADGQAACDRSRLGWRFRITGDPTGRTYTCTDTGNLVGGDHVDVWHYLASEGWQWLAAVRSYAWVEWLAPAR